jgi:hypothetical protein
MSPPTQSWLQFSWCSHTWATSRNATALPDFLCTCFVLLSENHTVQKKLTTMVTTRSPNPIQKNSPSTLTWSILMMHHPLSLSWQGTPTLRSPRNYFFEKKPFSTKFLECVNLRIQTHLEQKQDHFWPCQLRLLTPSIIIECKWQRVYFGIENNVSSFYFANFHTKFSQNTHLLSCYLSQCSYKHTTIN